MSTLDLLPYLESVGLESAYQRTDDEIVARCPAHEARVGHPDRRPSFGFNIAKGVGNCLSCGWHPTLPDLIQWLTGTAPDQDLLIGITEQAILDKLTQRKRERQPDFVVNEWTLGNKFQPVPEVLLSQRHLMRFAADFFGIRWDYQDHCWIIPIRSPIGVLLGWQQRQKGAFNTQPGGISKKETLFGHHLMCDDFDTVVLVESPLDAVRLWQCHIPSVAAMGAGVSNAQVDLLARHYTTIILALDDDPAGRQQNPRLVSMLRKRKKAPLLWRYDGRFKDVGDYEHDRDIIEAFRRTHSLS